jgi:hypothetical protein
VGVLIAVVLMAWLVLRSPGIAVQES